MQDSAVDPAVRLARIAKIAVVSLLSLAVIAGVIAGISGSQSDRIDTSWTEFASTPAEKGILLSDIRDRFGYGGLIHDFKNFVIRGTSDYEADARDDHTALSMAIEEYRALGITVRESEALAKIQETADRYRENIDVVARMHAAGAAIPDIDEAVKIDDGPALAALEILEDAWRGKFDEGRGALTAHTDDGLMWSRITQICAVAFVIIAAILAFWLLTLEKSLLKVVQTLEDTVLRSDGIVRNSADGILTVNSQGKIITFNDAAQETFGYDAGDAIGQSVNILVPDDTRDLHAGYVAKATSGAIADLVHPRRIHGRHRNGRAIPLEMRIAPYTYLGERHFIATFRDVTEKLRAEHQLRNAKDSAEQASNAKSAFLASMSHELRTPLNAVIGFSQMLRDGSTNKLEPRQVEWIDHIESAGKHLLGLVSQILDLSQVENGRLALEPRPVLVNGLIQDCLDQIRPAAERRNLRIRNTVHDTATVNLVTDPMRLRQCLLNLLSNAVKYNSEGGTIDLRILRRPDGFLRIAVGDTGPGIPDSERPHIFKMFHRLSSNPAVARDGAGIGLAVTLQIMSALGGRVGFDSTPGKGSTFWLELPTSAARNGNHPPERMNC